MYLHTNNVVRRKKNLIIKAKRSLVSNPDTPAGLANMITSGSSTEDTSTYSSNIIGTTSNTIPVTETSPSDMSILVTEDSSSAIAEDTDLVSTTEARTLISNSLRKPDENACYMMGDINVSECF